MNVGAFYYEGSNRIKIDVYLEETDSVVVNLLNSNVSDSTISILDSDDSKTRKEKLSKFIDRSVTLDSHHFNDNKATVYFNFLDFDVSSYLVEVVCGNEEQLYTINTIEEPSAFENNYIEDHISDSQNLNNTEISEEVFDIMPGTPILDIDFTARDIVKNGDLDIEYYGGGNRYLIDNKGILVKQVKECDSINDRYSPFQLGTTIKCEHDTENLFISFSYDTSSISHSTSEVQKGLIADNYRAVGKNNIRLTTDVDIVGSVCFSALLACDRKTKAKLRINSLEREIELGNEYNMYYVTSSCSGDSRFEIYVEDSSARLVVLLPQIEQGTYPTSRVIPGKSREKDCITICSDESNIVFDPEGSESTIGGFVNIEFIAGREFSYDNCLLDWRNDDLEGLIIYQDTSNSIVASFGENSVRTLPVTLEEGELYEVKVQWDMNNLGIQVNDDNPVLIQNVELTMPEEYPADIKVGWSNGYNSLDSDIVKLQIGQ